MRVGWNVFVNTANKYPGALASTVGFFPPGGNSVHLLFPLGKQNRWKSWACRGEVPARYLLGEHKVSVPSGAKRAEEKEEQGRAERQETSASLTCV